MDIGAPFILPIDIAIVPARDLPNGALAGVEWGPDDWTVTRPRSRTPTRVISADLAALLSRFREKRTIVQAVIDFSGEAGRDPETVLEQAMPALGRFIGSRWLVPPGSAAAETLEQTFGPGAFVGGFKIIECRHILEDTEVYAARDGNGRTVALKLARPFARQSIERIFTRETEILAHLGGAPAPQLISAGSHGGERYLAMEWCQGVPATTAAAEFNAEPTRASRQRLKAMGAAILSAYADLHRRGVLHGDIHPGNIVIGAGTVRLVDFGHGCFIGNGESDRTGVPYFFDPALAAALLAGQRPPPADTASEQYGLAGLLYLLLSGHKYLDFANEKRIALSQVATEPMLGFEARGTVPWPDAERLLSRALTKDPRERFGSIGALLDEWRAIEVVAPPRAAQHRVHRRDPFVEQTLAEIRAREYPETGSTSAIPTVSLTFGITGTAYAFYRLAQIRDDPAWLAEADRWLARALRMASRADAFHSAELNITEATVGLTSPYHNASGIYAVAALTARACGDFLAVGEAVRGYVAASGGAGAKLDLTTGRAGTLIGAALILEAVQTIPSYVGFGAEHAQSLYMLGNGTLAAIWARLDAYADLTACTELDNSGMAHGWSGLCYASLIWCRVAGAAVPGSLKARLEQLIGVAEPVGRGLRWPVQTVTGSQAKRRYLASWCNGAPGQTYLWHLAHRMFGDAHYAEIAEKCAWNAWEDRDPNPSLCCGFVGRAYALTAAYRASGDGVWLDRARAIASYARTLPSQPFMPSSLYKGELGVALLTAELERPDAAVLPFFELEGFARA